MIADFINYEFLRNALLAGIVASLICGMIGSYIVVRKIVFVSGGISHAAFGGIGFGYFLGFDPVLGAVGFSLVSGVLIGAIKRYSAQSEDIAIGILWAVGMALGILFISLTPGYAPDLFSYLFGNILFVPSSDLYLMTGMCLLTVFIMSILYKDIVAVSFDEDFAKIQGRPVTFIYYLMFALVGLSVVVLIKIVGIILVISLLTIPSAISLQYTKRFKSMILLSMIFALIFTVGGLLLSYRFDLQSGSTIILIACMGYVLSLVNRRLMKRGAKKTC